MFKNRQTLLLSHQSHEKQGTIQHGQTDTQAYQAALWEQVSNSRVEMNVEFAAKPFSIVYHGGILSEYPIRDRSWSAANNLLSNNQRDRLYSTMKSSHSSNFSLLSSFNSSFLLSYYFRPLYSEKRSKKDDKIKHSSLHDVLRRIYQSRYSDLGIFMKSHLLWCAKIKRGKAKSSRFFLAGPFARTRRRQSRTVGSSDMFASHAILTSSYSGLTGCFRLVCQDRHSIRPSTICIFM